MERFLQLIKTHRGLQVVLVVAILLALFLLNRWQKGQRETVEPVTTAVPAQLKLTAPPTAASTQTLRVSVNLDTKGQAVNTVTADFAYPRELLELEEIQVQDSFVRIWFDKRAQDGKVLLTGALPSPGFAGQSEVASVVFKALQEGTAELTFDANAAVFENGTSHNILGRSQGVEVKISP